MAVQTIYLLGSNGTTPSFWGNTQLNGSAPTAANSAFGWGPAKVALTTPYTRGRIGATTVSGDAPVASSIVSAASGPAAGTGTGATAASDSFVAGPFSGVFASGTWTFNFNLRASTPGAVGRINMRVWRSLNADGSSPTSTVAFVQGSIVTLSTTADVNSVITANPGTLTLSGHYLFFQVEWQETTVGSSNGNNVLFRVGTASITTTDFTPSVTGTLARTQDAQTLAAAGWSTCIGTLTATEAIDTIVSAGTVRVSGPLSLTEAADTLAATGTVPPAGTRTNVALASNGGTAVGSSTADAVNYAAANVISGSRDPTKGNGWGGPVPGGGWNDGTFQSYPDYMVITFNAAYAIDEIDVITLTDEFRTTHAPTLTEVFGYYGVTDYDVQYWDGAAYQTIASAPSNDKVWRQFTFAPITTTAIRIRCNAALADYSRLVEVEAWSTVGSDGSATGTLSLTQAAQTLSASGTVATVVTGRLGQSSATVLLVHADGTDGSTTFTDESPLSHALTPTNTTVNTTSPKFGTGRANLTDNIARIEAGDWAEFEFGADPFTVETWAYFTSAPVGLNMMLAKSGLGTGVNGWMFYVSGSQLVFRHSTTGSDAIQTNGTAATPPLNTWTHLAVDRDATTIRVYADGVVKASRTTSDVFYPQTGIGLRIGNDNTGTDPLKGYLDEIRITKGIARYAGAFTPPAAPFEIDYRLVQSGQTLSAAGTVGPVTVTGTLTVTQANQTLSATGTSPYVGTLTATQANQTLVATGTVRADGTLTVTEALDTLVAAGGIIAVGTLAITQANQTLVSAGTIRADGTLSRTQDPQTLAGTVRVDVWGAVNTTEALDTLTATGWFAAVGTLAVTETLDTITAVGLTSSVGTLAVTEGLDTIAAAGGPTVRGTLGVTEDLDTIAASGWATRVGILSITEALDTLAATGVLTVGGTLGITEALDTLTANGFVFSGNVGSLHLTQANQVLAATGFTPFVSSQTRVMVMA